MSERVHRVLDGELSPRDLSRSESAELAAYDEAMAQALAPLRSEAAPDLTGDVMRRVAALRAHGAPEPARADGLRGVLGLLWTPRPVSFRLRPAWALAAAAVLAVLGVTDRPAPAAPAPPAAVGSAGAAAGAGAGERQVLVQFRLEAPDAREVRLAADFTGWRPSHALHRSETGVWTVVVAVAPGVHQYGFVVDGERWTTDPLAPVVDDGFGGTNSRLDVLSLEGAVS